MNAGVPVLEFYLNKYTQFSQSRDVDLHKFIFNSKEALLKNIFWTCQLEKVKYNNTEKNVWK